jgi:hypothetical protein
MVRSLTSAGLTFACVAGLLNEASSGNVIRRLSLDAQAPVVELFDGMDSGRLQVKLVAKSAHEANVFIKNTTDAPLTVSLPKAALGVHILPQLQGPKAFINPQVNPFGANAPGNNGLGSNLLPAAIPGLGTQGEGRAQTIGGPFQPFGNQPAFPNQAGNNPPGFIGNGMFSIPPEKTVQLKLRTVCLDCGNPDPHLGLTYELRRLESLISDPVLRELLEDYSPRVDKEAMQAAAWHLANGLSWSQLATLPNPRALGAASMFNAKTVREAQGLVEQAEERAAKPAEKAKIVRTSALAE